MVYADTDIVLDIVMDITKKRLREYGGSWHPEDVCAQLITVAEVVGETFGYLIRNRINVDVDNDAAV
jgi:hypothetical protein